MAFEKLEFTKSWENAADFPTYEPSEAQVRADLQQLHNETRDGLNRLVDALNDSSAAAQMPFQAQGLEADNLQDAILEVYGAVQDAAAGQIVNGSVTKEKLDLALLERTYGGRPWVSMDTPGAGQTPDTDFPIGQVWLRPAFTVENLAGTDWSAVSGTAETVENGWKLTGDGSMPMVSMTQSMSNLGEAGQRAFVSLRASEVDSQLTGLTLYLNGMAHDFSGGGGVFETELDSQGGLEVVVKAQWPAAALAVGSVTLTHFAVVNADAVEVRLTDCAALSDWPALLTELVPFTEETLPREVYMQATPGQWHQISFEVLPVPRGGTGLDAPGEEGTVLQIQNGKPAWGQANQVVAALGALRLQTGSYTGDGVNRTLTLPVTPKLLLVYPQSGPLSDGYGGFFDNPHVLANGATVAETSTGDPYYRGYVSLSGAVLSFRYEAGNYKSGTLCGNRSGVAYTWAAVY